MMPGFQAARETPLLALWRRVDAILVAAGEPVATYGEMQHVNPAMHPLRAAFNIWSDRRK